MTFEGIDRPGRAALGRVLLGAGAMGEGWAPTFAAVDRAAFLPELMWPFDTRTQKAVAVDKAEEPDAWFAAADSDAPIVTQWDDGEHTGPGPGRVSTSSSSMPSVVYALLRDLAVDEGMAVLDVGTGTGETAGALAHRCGGRKVTTVEVDPSVSRHAGARLDTAGLHPHVVLGDGAKGCAGNAPYDRVLATVGVREIPGAWIEQTRPGGLIVAPWGTHYTHADAVARLVVRRDGTASGRFTGPVEFMKLRGQRLSLPPHKHYVMDEDGGADASTTGIPEGEFLTPPYSALPFALGLRVRHCVQVVAAPHEGARAVWFYGLTDRSWACVVFREGEAEARVWQAGERRLWDEVEAAYGWWVGHGRPDHARFGLTVGPGPAGRRVWLDDPADSWSP
ncbi:methyltransferase domain-containing protein [Streptomyces malaysiensis]|uniref:Protein-L-isoaspartate O-methyltransferase n=1 Tax=Streptomyces malaysiensis subsp. samsunensis TaxID=459658 RepID=A0A9X2LWW7_STRMQ|nr:methyltransferase domain-containing protein [Streptomyces samsunensis]MCQ8831112.1 methyltransferase domain-containing protein [Streptomyces samsunensis]